jgi:hypothetical protein
MTSRTAKRFKIISVEGPTDRGALNQLHDYLIEIELDPGEPYLSEMVKAAVRLDDGQFYSLAQSEPEHGKAFIAHYVSEKLRSILKLPDANIKQVFKPTREEMAELRRIDPARVVISNWITIRETEVDSSEKGSTGVNITVVNGDLNVGGDIIGRDKTTNSQ